MKNIIIHLTLILFSTICQANQFMGSWQLVSGEYVDDKNVTHSYENLKLESIVVLSDTYYSFVTLSKGKFWASGVGSYSYTDEIYSEKPTYTSYDLNGRTLYTFKYRFDGDLWYKSRWENGLRMEHEVWKRIKKK